MQEGHDYRTLRVLTGKAVELGFVEERLPETFRALLNELTSGLGAIGNGVFRR
jgi:hypothetical protein